MSSEFQLAVDCLCCKQDIPQVQAVIRLLDPLLQRELATVAESVLRELLKRLDAYTDTIGAADVDVLVAAGKDRTEVLAAILNSLLLGVRQGYGAFVSGEFARQVEDGVDALFAFGTREAGFAFSGPERDLLRQAAINQLDTLVQSTVLERQGELRELLERYLTTAGPRSIGATLEAAAGDSVATSAAWQTSVGSILSPRRAASATIDNWAYLWSNVAGISAAIASGARAFEAVAVVDTNTTRFCRWVNGRIVPLGRIQKQLAAVRSSGLDGNFSSIRQAWPFIDAEIARNGNELQFELYFRRAALSPYHFGCRTRILPIRL